ncbi:hypothetical protein NUU61_008700 [Penicillium alfredii]|uniref:Mitochondrial division protein 1 n=1 Tax=Penicillium alfredii TaxID=1506179 RepID=A0A9W9JWM7_9EURO|nr:uncharacterized protein NUU61_008700 [Penicillium alfredii]KAJ5084121.1 hypothetical protein NUU61_008700 [Penicillium alfredii]
MRSMNQKKFLEQYVYALENDFTSPNGEPAAWAPDHPKYWGQERAKIGLDGNRITPALSPDNRFLAVGAEQEIHVIDVTTQERLEVLRGHSGELEKVQFAPELVDHGDNQNGTRYLLVSECDAEIVILWELNERGNLVLSKEDKEKAVDADTLATETLQPLVSKLVTDHGWNTDDKAIDALNNEVRSALRSAITLHEQERRLCFRGQLASFGSAAFSPDGKTLLYLSQNESTQGGSRDATSLPCVNVWDVEKRYLRHQLLGHADAIMWTAMSPDSRLVASIAWDGTARIWDTTSGECLRVVGPLGGQLWSGAFSPDAKWLAISQGSPKTHIHVYDISTGEPVSRFDGSRRWARSLAWSPDGTMLACGTDDSTLFIWDPITGQERMRWRLAFEDWMMRSFASIGGVRFLDGGRKLIFQIREGTVEIYDFETNLKQQLTRGAEDQIDQCPNSEVVCSADSRLIVVPDGDGVLRVWDL